MGDDSRTQAGERDEDMYSTDTNYREAGSVTSAGAEPEAMDEDMNSHGAYDDRMSDDGSSLVGFGEGAGYMLSVALKKYGGYVEAEEIGLPVMSSGLILPCGASGRWER